jgi:fermentation-respiration switch protein FrsA (DUF1100 family)
LLGGCYALQRSLMYFPAAALPSPAAAGVPEMVPVTPRTDDGMALVAWYAAARAPRSPTIVYFHGNAGNIADRAYKVRPMLDAGLGVLLVSYRGYGGTPGTPSEAGLFADGRAALDFLSSHGVAAEKIVVYGESLGSRVAVRLASERRLGAVVLEAPFTSAADTGQRAYPFLPVRQLIRDRFDSLSRIAAIGALLLIVHGERDRVVPVDHGRRLLVAALEPKEGVFLPEAGHNDAFEYGAMGVALEFLDRVYSDEAAGKGAVEGAVRAR